MNCEWCKHREAIWVGGSWGKDNFDVFCDDCKPFFKHAYPGSPIRSLTKLLGADAIVDEFIVQDPDYGPFLSH